MNNYPPAIQEWQRTYRSLQGCESPSVTYIGQGKFQIEGHKPVDLGWFVDEVRRMARKREELK